MEKGEEVGREGQVTGTGGKVRGHLVETGRDWQ